jgi:flagellar assembly protein FliH
MSGVIKAGILRGGGDDPQVVTFSLADLHDRGDAYVAQVRQQAARAVQQARDDAEAVRKQAQEEGRQAALAAAEKSVQARLDQQLKTLFPALRQAVQSLHEARHAWLLSWEGNVVRLAVAIAARVIRRELSQTPEITLDLVRESLELAAGSGSIKVLLHPGDHAALGEQVKKLAGEIARLAPAEIVADASVEPGGCRVLTEFGEVDQRIASQLTRIEEELRAA